MLDVLLLLCSILCITVTDCTGTGAKSCSVSQLESVESVMRKCVTVMTKL